jgi:hypothetical protein
VGDQIVSFVRIVPKNWMVEGRSIQHKLHNPFDRQIRPLLRVRLRRVSDPTACKRTFRRQRDRETESQCPTAGVVVAGVVVSITPAPS